MGVKEIWKDLNNSIESNQFLNKIDHLDTLLEDSVRLGIDIGAHSVKFVQLQSGAGKASVVSMGCREIPHSTNTKTPESEQSQIIEIMNEMMQSQKIKSKNVQLVISDPAVYSRPITLPRVTEDELDKAIKWQAEKYAPFPIDTALVDYQPLESAGNKDQNQMEVVIVAVERKVIDHYLAVLKGLKLVPQVIDVSPFAVGKSLLKNYSIEEDEILPVIDIGAKTTSVVMMKPQALQMVRNVDVAGSTFTGALREALGLDLQEAEKLKQDSFELSSSDGSTGQAGIKVYSILEPVLKDLVAKVERSFAYCEKELLNERIKRVILCGGGANIKGIAPYLSKALELPVEVANPFTNFTVDKKIDEAELQVLAPKMMAAIGGIL